jgi:hypothetical protein
LLNKDKSMKRDSVYVARSYSLMIVGSHVVMMAVMSSLRARNGRGIELLTKHGSSTVVVNISTW